MNIWLAVVLVILSLPIFIMFDGVIGFILSFILLIITHFVVEGKKKTKLEDRYQELLKAAKNDSKR